MLISCSLWRKVAVTVGAVVGFVFVYETSIRDLRVSGRPDTLIETPAPSGRRLTFTATAYCKGQTTASGVTVRTGIAAADPALLPVGTVIRVDTPDPKLDGIWTIMDTGPAVQGRTVDFYLWSCHEALRFGRQPIQVEVLRLGWHPQTSQPGRADVLFRRREVERDRLDEATPSLVPASDAVPALAPLPIQPPASPQ